MTPALIFQKVRLAREASPFTTSLPTGCSVLVLGRDVDGVEAFWNLIGGESPAQGKIFRSGAVHSLTREKVGRASVQGYLESLGGPTLEALAISRLDDLRRKSAASLEPARWAQLEFAAALCSPAPIVALSAMLDNLDPWGEATLRDAQRAWGRTTIRFSRNPEQCAHADQVLILGRQTVLFADTPDHLRRSCLPVTYEVITGEPSSALAICAPPSRGHDEMRPRNRSITFGPTGAPPSWMANLPRSDVTRLRRVGVGEVALALVSCG